MTCMSQELLQQQYHLLCFGYSHIVSVPGTNHDIKVFTLFVGLPVQHSSSETTSCWEWPTMGGLRTVSPSSKE